MFAFPRTTLPPSAFLEMPQMSFAVPQWSTRSSDVPQPRLHSHTHDGLLPGRGSYSTPKPEPTDPSKPKVRTFPCPPPRTSAMYTIPDTLLRNRGQKPSTLGDANAKLIAALDGPGYIDRSWYATCGGFALVTRLERVQSDGRPWSEPGRWAGPDASASELAEWSVGAYIRALFRADPGRYRVIAFIATDKDVTTTGKALTAKEAQTWLDNGHNRLPQEIANQQWTDEHQIVALIYEFKKKKKEEPPEPDVPSPLAAQDHMKGAGILTGFGAP